MPVLTKPDGHRWRDFEHLCLILFEHYFDAPDANFYGTRGVGQNGIDIRMTTIKGDVPAKVVVQCKATDSLSWSDFANDFKSALVAFARETLAEGRDFRFIVATTAGGVNEKPFDDNKKVLLEELELDSESARIHLAVYPWPRLENLVESTPSLRKLFVHQERPADALSSQNLGQLVARLTRLTEANLLDSAWSELNKYVRAEKPDAPDKFHWAPSTLFDPLAKLFLKAGDFFNASRLLNTALGTNPLNADFLLGYLRAQRVLHAAKQHNRLRAYPFETYVTPRSMHEEVDEMAEQLLRAGGDTDSQLNLALWVVSYAETQTLANAGLRRALGLVTQAWPDKVDRLEHDVKYTMTADGYVLQQPDPFAVRPPAQKAHLRACALAAACTYIRTIYAVRFNTDLGTNVEGDHEDWPVEIEGITTGDPFCFFAQMAPVATCAMRDYLPSFYAEAANREFHWNIVDQYGPASPPALDSSNYVTTPEFLLRDCVGGLVQSRIDEFRRAGSMGYGATILISHLGLERLARVQLGYALESATQGRMGEAAGAAATGIDVIFAHLERQERLSGPNDVRPTFASRTCYVDFGKAHPIDCLGASIALSKRHSTPFLAILPGEFALAGSVLPATIKRFIYWTPTRTHFISANNSLAF